MKLRDVFITTIIILFFALIVIFFLFKGWKANYEERENQDKEANVYYSKYNIKLKGVIVNKINIDGRYCTYTLKVTESNNDKHDLREYNEDYYLVIYGDSAKMVDGNYCGQINDSIIIDYTKRHKVSWNLKRRFETGLIIFSPTYRSLRKQGLGS